jgi:hypothetical protein
MSGKNNKKLRKFVKLNEHHFRYGIVKKVFYHASQPQKQIFLKEINQTIETVIPHK